MRLHRRAGTLVAVVLTLGVLAPLGWLWQGSRLPSSYAATDMGYPDLGGEVFAEHTTEHTTDAHPAGGTAAADAPGHDVTVDSVPARSVDTYAPPATRPADVEVTPVARAEDIELATGTTVDGYTLNGTSPGPEIRAVEGQLVEVRLVNESVPGGATLHWHGVDVPNAMDGVAGVTQDAVPVGGEHVYRFVADDVGTYWYHSHQLSHEQVRRGLLGALVIESADGTPAADDPIGDAVALLHLYQGVRTVNGRPGESHHVVEPGATVRLRVINTDNGPTSVWVSGAPFRLLAIDGTDVSEPATVSDVAVQVTAGARADLEVQTPADGSGARLELGGVALVLGPDDARPVATPRPSQQLDPLTYGRPAPLPFDADAADRSFEYRIGRRPGFLAGRPGLWWTVNGGIYPDVPMFMVAAGDVVRMRVSNDSGQGHPMHLHGHHAVVLARDGVAATGSPWWVDSLEVGDGETYDLAFVADNPGIWMDHCHNLPHAAEGLVAHLMYQGVSTPYRLGGGNVPE